MELSDNDIVESFLDYLLKYTVWDDVIEWERDIRDYGKVQRLRL